MNHRNKWYDNDEPLQFMANKITVPPWS